MTPAIKALSELQAGDHVCWFYEREEDHRAVVSRFVRIGLERGEKVLYVADTHSPDTILGYLRDDGLAVDEFLRRGQLVVATSDTVYLREGHFDPHAMCAHFRAETLRALDEGYAALRVTGEMEWASAAEHGCERLVEYEVQLHDFVAGSRCLLICQFYQRRVEPSLLLDVLQAHPWVILGQLAFRNLYYVPGKDLLTSRAIHTLRRWLMTVKNVAYASETLRRSEENFRRLFETMAQGIVYQAADGRILAANPAAEQILGLSVETMRGRNWNDPCWQAVREDGSPLPGEEHPAMVALRTGKPVGGVVLGMFNPKRHARVWLLVTAIPQFRPGKRAPFQVFTTFVDITEQRLTEQRLRESELRFRQFAENLPEMFWVVTPDWKTVEYINLVYEKVTGQSCESLRQHPSSWLQSVHPEDRRRVREAILAYDPSKGEPLTLPEARIVHLDGSIRWMRSRGFPIRDAEGRVYRVAGISEDISERKRAEAALHQRVAFERLVAEIGAELAAARGAAVAEAIDRALEAIGQFTHVDRAAVIEFLEEGGRTTTTHQWVAGGGVPWEGTPESGAMEEYLPWCVQRIRNHEVVCVPNVAALPPDADRDRQHLAAQGVQSLIAVPMLASQRLIGVLRLDCFRRCRGWAEEDQTLLRCVAQAIGGARMRAFAEELLQQERDRAQHYLNTVEAIIVALDREGRIILINNKGCRLLGYREEELLGKDWFTTCLPQPEGTQTVRSVFFSLLAGDTSPVEYYTNAVLTRDGQRREIAWHNTILRDASGKIVGTLSAGEDVTDRLRAEAELRESKQWLEMAIRAGNIGLWEWDLRTNRVYFSPEWKRQIGYEDHELPSTIEEWHSRIHPEDRALVLDKIDQFIKNRQSHGHAEYRFRHKDGSYRWILDQASLQVDELGLPLRAIGSHTDISQTKALEAELRASLQRQAEVEKLAATGRMAATVAHEINNPLAGIKNAFRLVRDAVPPDHPDRDMVDRMAREIDRIAEIVRQMYQIYSPRKEQPTDVPLASIVRDVALFLEHLCRERQVRIAIGDIPADWTVRVPGGSLHQVLYNLVANGVHASPDGGVVHIEAEMDGPRWLGIHVRDQGPGIPAEVQENLFQPFVSAPVGDRSTRGLGLGLAVVKSIVDSLGGRVEFETAAGRGTTFRVYLPRSDGPVCES